MVKNPPASVGVVRDVGLIPGSTSYPGEGHGNPLQYSCLENPHGQSSLVSCSPLGHNESDTTEQLSQSKNREIKERKLGQVKCKSM